jgi:hypothetical protein
MYIIYLEGKTFSDMEEKGADMKYLLWKLKTLFCRHSEEWVVGCADASLNGAHVYNYCEKCGRVVKEW